jgi:hypothetical protein
MSESKRLSAEELAAQRQETLQMLGEDRDGWLATASARPNVLLGDRQIVVDRHDRGYSSFRHESRMREGLTQVPRDMHGVIKFDADGAACVKARLEREAPDFAPYVAWDFQDYARSQATRAQELINTISDLAANAATPTASPAPVDKADARAVSEQYRDLLFALHDAWGNVHTRGDADMKETWGRLIRENGEFAEPPPVPSAEINARLYAALDSAKRLLAEPFVRQSLRDKIAHVLAEHANLRQQADLAIQVPQVQDTVAGDAGGDRLDPARVDEIRGVLKLFVDRLHDSDFMKPHAREALKAVTVDGSGVSADQARLVLRVLSDFDRRMRDLDDGHQAQAWSGKLQGGQADADGVVQRRAADIEGYLVVEITDTASVAFSDVGRDFEVARIIKEAAGKAWREDFRSGSVALTDLNSNPVGSMYFSEAQPADELPEGGVRLTVRTTADVGEDDLGSNVSRVMMALAHRVERGEHDFGSPNGRAFSIRSVGGEVGRVQICEPRSPELSGEPADRTVGSEVEPG